MGTAAALGLATSAFSATHEVAVQGLSFSPNDLTVAAGDTVSFSGGGNFHTVTGDGAEPFCGVGTFTRCSVTFNNVGTFAYHCIPHQSQGMIGVIRVVEPVTSPLTVTVQGKGTVAPDLNGMALLVGGSYTITALPGAGFGFVGWTGGITSNPPRLTFVMQSNLTLHAAFADTTPPSVTITAPAANARSISNNTVFLQGTTSDGDAVAAVEYRVVNAEGSGGFQAADGTTSWSATVSDLVPGTNQFYARARDASGNVSDEIVRSVVLLTRLTVTTNGAGTVTAGFLGTTFRDPGKRLSLTATPRNGLLFSNWTGTIETTANPLNFLPSSNMTLQANFAANPFLPVSGSYNGLFYVDDETLGVRHETSGAFSLLLSKLRSYSGRLQLAGKRYPFSGQFDLEGNASNAVKRTGANDLSMELALDLAGGSDRILGRVNEPLANWNAELAGDRAPIYAGTNASPYRGKYTLIVTNEDSETQLGDSFGTATIDARNKLTFRGSLADGTSVSQSVPVSKDGQWPLYAALYAGKGSILSWVVVSTNASPDASLYGEFSWIKPSLPAAKFYPGGFTNALDLAGSIYQAPGTNRVLELSQATLSVSGGNLAGEFANTIAFGPRNIITNLTPAQPLVLTLTLPTGLFKGTLKVNDGGVNKTLALKGALLQHQNRGAGFFLGTNESGPVRLEP